MFFSKISRVDVQVSLLTAAIVLLSVLCVHLFHYSYTYKDMIFALNGHSMNIYASLEERMDKTTFYEIHTAEDEQKASYRAAKTLLEETKAMTGVRYLYTAKQREDGSFIYVVDGLDAGSADFRHAGDLIETEIGSDMRRALEGHAVLPERIKRTEWGYMFVSYFPVYDEGKVVGVLGIEFDAGQQYKTFETLRFGTPLIAAVACLLGSLIAVRMFRRVSNPAFQDIATTDYLTRLKNRNAFEIDLHNLERRVSDLSIALISADLNDLKTVNDRLGHQAGDLYIGAAAEILRSSVEEGQVVYRIGGDEFAVLLPVEQGGAEETCRRIIARIKESVRLANKDSAFAMYISLGYAVYDWQEDRDLFATLNRADQRMYENKRARKEAALKERGRKSAESKR